MAATGAAVNGHCYASQAEALDAYYSVAPVDVVSGSTSYATTFTKVSGVWKATGWSISSAGAWTQRFQTNAPVPVFPVCDPAERFVDGVQVGWGVAAAIAFVMAVKMMKKAL